MLDLNQSSVKNECLLSLSNARPLCQSSPQIELNSNLRTESLTMSNMNYSASPFLGKIAKEDNVYQDSYLEESSDRGESNQERQGGIGVFEYSREQQMNSACIEDYAMTAAQPSQISKKIQVKSPRGDLNQQAKDVEQSSAGLQTNPTFVSIHQADPSDANLESQYLKEHAAPDTELNEESCEVLASQRPQQLKGSINQQIFVWGSNDSGQLGLSSGNFGHFYVPLSIEFHQKIMSVSCGEQHTAMVTFSKQLFVMGSNSHGQLGLGDPSDIQKCTVPTLVQSLAHLQVMSAYCGAKHTLSIAKEIIGDRSTYVYSWGDNSRGQIGTGEDEIVLGPHKIDFGDDDESVNIEKVSAGKDHSFFMDVKNGQVFACGEARQGQLGIGFGHEVVRTPIRVDSLSDQQIVEVACGESHTLAVNFAGQVLASGSNVTGQLGLGHTSSKHQFEKVPGLTNILHVGASTHSTAVDSDGRLFRWGQGVKGVYLAPLKIASPRPIFIDQVSMGSDFGIVKNKKGEIFTYGVNQDGQLGLGDNESRSTLNSLVQLNQLGSIRKMAAGSNFAVCLIDVSIGEPSKYFATEISMVPGSAPVMKQGQLKNRDRTSVTEFNDFGGNEEVFAIMSEKRVLKAEPAKDTLYLRNSNRLKGKMLSQQGLPGRHDLTGAEQNNSDLGTINTMQTQQNVMNTRAFHHELSQETQLIEYEQVPLPQASTNTYRRQFPYEVTRSDQQNEDAVPPYTRSPFNADRKINLSNTASTSLQLTKSSNRFDIYSNGPGKQDVRAPPPHNVEILEQITLAEKLELKSDFARGRSQSSERRQNKVKNATGSYENPVSDSSASVAYQSKNQYSGLESTTQVRPEALQSLPPDHQTLKRSLSPANRHLHQQLPSFSAQEPNQFRSRSINSGGVSRHSKTAHASGMLSLENTGEFVNSYVRYQQQQQNLQMIPTRDQEEDMRHSQITDYALTQTHGDDFTVHHMSSQMQQQSSVQERSMEQNQTLTLENDHAWISSNQTFDQTAGSHLFQGGRHKHPEQVTMATNAYRQFEQHHQPQQTQYSMIMEERHSSEMNSANTSDCIPMISSRVKQTQENQQQLNNRLNHAFRDHSGSQRRSHRHTSAMHEQNQQQQPRKYKRPRSVGRHSAPGSTVYSLTRQTAAMPHYQHQQHRCYQIETSHNESSILQQPLLTNSTIQTFESNTPSQTTKRDSVGRGIQAKLPPHQVQQYHLKTHDQPRAQPNYRSSSSGHAYPYPKQHRQHNQTFEQGRPGSNLRSSNNAILLGAQVGPNCRGCGAGYQSSQSVLDLSQQQAQFSVRSGRNGGSKGRAKSMSRSRSRCANCRNREGAVNHEQVAVRLQPVLNGCTSCTHMIPQQQKQYANANSGASTAFVMTQQSSDALRVKMPPARQSSKNQIQTSQQALGEKKLRKKYRRLKQDSSRAQMEQLAENEKLKLRIHELQSMIHQRDTAERQTSMQQSEGYQGLVSRYTKEMSELQDKVCQLERALIAKDSQVKVINREGEASRQQIQDLESDLQKVTQENSTLKQEAIKMIDEIEQLQTCKRDQNHSLQSLQEQCEAKNKLCTDQESSMQHLNKTLDDLKTSFEAAKAHATRVMGDNDSLRCEMRTCHENLKVHEKQADNLRSFIEELEVNNKELVRYIDQQQLAQASEYRSKVSQALSQHRRLGAKAALRRSSKEDEIYNPNPAEVRSATFQYSQLLSKSHSPVARQQYASSQPKHVSELVSYRKTEKLTSLEAEQVEQANQREQLLSPQGFGAHLVGLRPGPGIKQHFQKQQNHCIRNKSSKKTQVVQSSISSLSPAALSNSRTCYVSIVDQERKEHLDARQQMKQMLQKIHKERVCEPTKPIEQQLITKSGQLDDEVMKYQETLKRDEFAPVNPRHRLNGRTPTRTHHRSVSPVEFLNQQHNTSYVSRRSLSRSVSANARSTVSNGSAKNISRSQDSLQVQYQKVTQTVKQSVPTFWRPEERLPAEQKLVQWKMPDIKNVLASSPGKSKVARRERRKSPALKEKVTYTFENTEAVPLTNKAQNEAEGQAEEPSRMPFYPKITGTVLRSQLHNMTETLAQLKRNRIKLEGSMRTYDEEQEQRH